MLDHAVKTALLEGLSTRGWFASPELVPRSIALQLREQLLIHKDHKTLLPAEIGQGRQKQARPDVRGDSILWLDPENATELEKNFWIWLRNLKNLMNQHLQLGLQSEEIHYALYPPGSGYQKHKDSFEKDSARTISFVLYLNQNWLPENGGQIAIYNEQNPDKKEAEINPDFAQCVLFLSANIFHEVIFTKEERISVTGWLKKTASGAVLPRF